MREAVKLKSLNLNLRNSLPNRIKSKVKRDLVHFVNPNAYFRGLLAKQIHSLRAHLIPYRSTWIF